MARMKPPRIPETSPDVLDPEDLRKLLKACEGQAFDERRDMAVIRILLDTGLRRAEMVGLALDDVDLDGQTLRVTGKGGRPRTVPYGRKAARDMDRYLRVRQLTPDAASPKLWLGQRGPLGPTGLYRMQGRAHRQHDEQVAVTLSNCFRLSTFSLRIDFHRRVEKARDELLMTITT